MVEGEISMRVKTLHQIQQEGLEILVDKLGMADAIRFLQIYDMGSSNWTKDRKNLLERDPELLLSHIMQRRKTHNNH